MTKVLSLMTYGNLSLTVLFSYVVSVLSLLVILVLFLYVPPLRIYSSFCMMVFMRDCPGNLLRMI